MNRKRNIEFASAICIVALMLTAGWGVLSANAWPPEPMPVYSLAGTWLQTVTEDPQDAIDIVTISPEDPSTGRGFYVATDINPDVTAGGLWPEADSWSQWTGTYVRTGPDTWQFKLVCYVKKDTKPKATVLLIMVLDGTWIMSSPNMVDGMGTISFYGADQDIDGDGLPDEGQQPNMSMQTSFYMKLL
jgi:hypothetical protein